jgi:Tol biopolymer transport system component
MRKLLITCCLFVSVSTLASAKIIFDAKREDNFEIYRMNDDGSNLQRLTNNPRYDHCARWSPDGKQIVFVRRFDEERRQQGNLFLINADGSNERRLTNAPENDGPNITWAPDGKRVAFVRRPQNKGQIHVLDIATGSVKQLTNNDGLIVDPRWSPDGKTIVYRYEGKDGKSIYTMSSTGKNQKHLIPPKDGPILRFSPAWSPDSKRIVYCEMEWINEKPEVRLIIYNILSKQQQIRHFRQGIQDVSWMGDDAILLSMIENKSNKYDLYQYHIGNDTFINLTNTPTLNEYNPHWVGDNAFDVSPKEKETTLWGKIKNKG